MKTWRDLNGLSDKNQVGPFDRQILDEIEGKHPINWEKGCDFFEWLMAAEQRGLINSERLGLLLEYSTTIAK